MQKKGNDVIITYKSKKEEAEEVVSQINQLGRKAAALQLDVSESKKFDSFVESFKNLLKNNWNKNDFDVLINNAGIGVNKPFIETSESEFDQMMNIHLKGPFFLIQKLLPLIKDGGRIINVSTGLTRFSIPGYSAYSTMKGGIEILTLYLAKELGNRKITVNVIAPGAIETDFGGGYIRDNKEVNKYVAAQTALGRVGQPDDVGAAVASLVSDDFRWVTDQRIEISGGMFL